MRSSAKSVSANASLSRRSSQSRVSSHSGKMMSRRSFQQRAPSSLGGERGDPPTWRPILGFACASGTRSEAVAGFHGGREALARAHDRLPSFVPFRRRPRPKSFPSRSLRRRRNTRRKSTNRVLILPCRLEKWL